MASRGLPGESWMLVGCGVCVAALRPGPHLWFDPILRRADERVGAAPTRRSRGVRRGA